MSKVYLTVGGVIYVLVVALDISSRPVESLVDTLFKNPYFLVTYGSLFYHFVKYRRTKDAAEHNNDKIHGYISKNWDDWVYSLLWIPLAGYFGESWYYDLKPYVDSWYVIGWLWSVGWGPFSYVVLGIIGELTYLGASSLWDSGIVSGFWNGFIKRVKAMQKAPK